MIFLTVGTQLPFDRLVEIVDESAVYIDISIFSQIGKGIYKPKNISFKEFYQPDDMDLMFSKAKLVVSHAGMGSIINCLKLKKTIIIFPRLKKYSEHRNDHQLDTVEAFKNVKGVYVAYNSKQLIEFILNYKKLEKPIGFSYNNSSTLANFIRMEYF